MALRSEAKKKTDADRERARYANGESWYFKNRDRAIANQRRYRQRNAVALMLYKAKRRALEKSIPFDLVESDVVIPEICPVLGIRLSSAKDSSGIQSDACPTLDRVVPSLGYVSGNVEVISWRANRIKSDASADEIRAIYAWLERRA